MISHFDKPYLWVFLTFFSMSVIASPPPLPIAGDLTDPEGNPLNETVTLTFSLTESETSDQVLWTEQHDNVTVKQGRFAVLLGTRKDLLKDGGSPIDFTQKKYIKVEVEIKRDGKKESYSLTPPLLYMPALGAWQAVHADKAKHAVQADNAAKLESHQLKDIEAIIDLKLDKLRQDLNTLNNEVNLNKGNVQQKLLLLDDLNKKISNLKIVGSCRWLEWQNRGPLETGFHCLAGEYIRSVRYSHALHAAWWSEDVQYECCRLPTP